MAAPGPDWAVLDVGTGTGHTALAPHVASVILVEKDGQLHFNHWFVMVSATRGD